jgi:hypothetical protein
MRKFSNRKITLQLRELRAEYKRLTIRGQYTKAMNLRRYIATLKALASEVAA